MMCLASRLEYSTIESFLPVINNYANGAGPAGRGDGASRGGAAAAREELRCFWVGGCMWMGGWVGGGTCRPRNETIKNLGLRSLICCSQLCFFSFFLLPQNDNPARVAAFQRR